MSDKNPFNLLDIAAARQQKALSMAAPYVKDENLEAGLFAPQFNVQERAQIQAALEFIRTVKLVGREPNYMGHAVRVGVFYREYAPAPVAAGVVLGLLHNVLEVTAISSDELEKRFGKRILEGCQILVVDRKKQTDDPAYMPAYYQQLKQSRVNIQQIKVLDKFDNLLVLFLNSSAATRSQYLDEIERWIIPLVEAQLPALLTVYREATRQARSMPQRTLTEFLAAKQGVRN